MKRSKLFWRNVNVRRVVLRPNRDRWACGGNIRDREHYAGRHGKDCESKTNFCRTHLAEFLLKQHQIVLVAVLLKAWRGAFAHKLAGLGCDSVSTRSRYRIPF